MSSVERFCRNIYQKVEEFQEKLTQLQVECAIITFEILNYLRSDEWNQGITRELQTILDYDHQHILEGENIDVITLSGGESDDDSAHKETEKGQNGTEKAADKAGTAT